MSNLVAGTGMRIDVSMDHLFNNQNKVLRTWYLKSLLAKNLPPRVGRVGGTIEEVSSSHL